MPNGRALALPGVTEAVVFDASIRELSLYVADAGQGSVDVLKLSSARSAQQLTPAGQILKLKVSMNEGCQVFKSWKGFIKGLYIQASIFFFKKN